MSLYHADCDGCGYQLKLYDIQRSYQMGDSAGQTLTIRAEFAWCESCREVVWAERVDDIADLEAELELDAREGEEFFGIGGGDWRAEKARHLAELRRRIAWRRGRVSPPKCLECGSSAILSFPEVNDKDETASGIEHPGCGGRLSVVSAGLALTRLWIFYSPEGNKLGTYEVSPSWGLVKRDDA